MKLHLPVTLRMALMAAMVAASTLGSYTLAADTVTKSAHTESWPSGSEVLLETSDGTVSITTTTSEVSGAEVITVAPGANYTITVNEGANSGYGVLGNGETVINVEIAENIVYELSAVITE